MNNASDFVMGRQPVPGKPAMVQVVFREWDDIEVPVRIWVDFGLKIGLDISRTTYEELQTAAVSAKARERALQFLADRPRTAREVLQRLQKAGYSESVAVDVVAGLAREGVVNDSDYARMMVRQAGARSKRELLWKLRQRGVASEDAKSALAELDPDAEYLAASGLAEKYLRSHRAADKTQTRRKLAAHLQRKGYPSAVIRRILETVLDDTDSFPSV